MAFFDKIGDLTKNVGDKASEITKNIGDKTSDIVENNRASMRISSEKKHIAEYKSRIGDIYYKKYSDGNKADADADVDEICALIMESEKTILSLEKEIESRKAENQARREAAKEEASEKREKRAFENKEGRCPKCGLIFNEDVSVCPRCGAGAPKDEDPLESKVFTVIVTDTPAADAVRESAATIDGVSFSATQVCPVCGESLSVQARFCTVCGVSVKAPEQPEPGKRICPVCGEEMQEGVYFCANCGSKQD